MGPDGSTPPGIEDKVVERRWFENREVVVREGVFVCVVLVGAGWQYPPWKEVIRR